MSGGIRLRRMLQFAPKCSSLLRFAASKPSMQNEPTAEERTPECARMCQDVPKCARMCHSHLECKTNPPRETGGRKRDAQNEPTARNRAVSRGQAKESVR